MIAEQFENILLPIVLNGLSSLISVLLHIAVILMSFFCVLYGTWLVVSLICPELHDIIVGTIGGVWDNYKADRKERFANSPVGRGYAAYKERSVFMMALEKFI